MSVRCPGCKRLIDGSEIVSCTTCGDVLCTTCGDEAGVCERCGGEMKYYS